MTIRVFQQRAEQTVSGFRPASDDYLEGRLNITDLIVVDPHCTFYFQMDTEDMKSYGIRKGDLLVIDKSLKPVKDAIVVAYVEDAFYCRSYAFDNGEPCLISDKDLLKSTNGEVLQVWGVVTSFHRNTLPKKLRSGKYYRVCSL